MGRRRLKAHLKAVLREMERTGQVVEVTRRGRVVARLVPVRPARDRDANGAWTALVDLAAEISANWPPGVTVAEAVADVRRGL